ncbi:MAG: peptide chain release factor N(5)-glutamine methyltransferase [Acidimicrobiales bacterium]
MSETTPGFLPRAARTRWEDLLVEAEAALPPVEAHRILEQVSGLSRSEMVVGLGDPVPERVIPYFREKVARRAAGEPLQYVLGSWAFRSLDLMVDQRVLIPRPETEFVVEEGIRALKACPDAEAPVLVDLGTGSGAIGLSLAVEIPTAEVWATDRSSEALDVARANLIGIGTFAATRVRLVEGSWYGALPQVIRGRVAMIISNPPYVADGEDLPEEVGYWEPASALRAGPDGLDDVRVIVDGAPHWLVDGGALVVEIAPSQAGSVVDLARAAGFGSADVKPDLTGRPRVLVAR